MPGHMSDRLHLSAEDDDMHYSTRSGTHRDDAREKYCATVQGIRIEIPP